MEILASQLTGLMDMKIFYKGKNTGKAASPSASPDSVSIKGLSVGSLDAEPDLAVCLSLVTTTCTLFNVFLMAS